MFISTLVWLLIVSHNIIIEKVMKYGLNKWTLRWTKNWLNCQAQSIVISGTKSCWWPVTSGVPQELILGPVLFNALIKYLGDGTECTLGKFAEDRKLGRVGSTLEGCAATQRDLERLENWDDRNLMKCNKVKCQVLPWGRNSLSAISLLGCAMKSIASKSREVIFSLCSAHIWSAVLEHTGVKQRATKMNAKMTFQCEGGWTQAQVAQSGCGVLVCPSLEIFRRGLGTLPSDLF